MHKSNQLYTERQKDTTEQILIFDKIAQYLEIEGFKIFSRDENRPWGGFFVIEEEQAQLFLEHFFHNLSSNNLLTCGKISPKILIVAPHKRLSWQYHHRRAEFWKVIEGPVGIKISDKNHEGELVEYCTNHQIELKKGVRHRLIGLNNWGVIAEVWIHTDPENPSDENDIIRLQDDFGR